jgi:probable HAF family extracellular repeat protein
MKPLLNIASILAFCASTLSGHAALALKYHVLAITPGSAQGVNDKGEVVGTLTVLSNPPPPVWYQGGTYVTHAFLYKGGKVLDLGVLFNPNDPAFDSTEGEAINNSDIIAGNIVDVGPGDESGGILDGFSWKNGVFTDIASGSTDGGNSADAVGVNEQGTAVGTYDATELLHKLKVPGLGLFGYPHAYVSLNNVLTDLGTLAGQNGNYSYGNAVNNAGQVVGVSTNTTTLLGGDSDSNGNPYYAFLWSNGKMQSIGGTQSVNFTPAAINDNGWIAGTLGRIPIYPYVYPSHSGQAVLYVNNRFITIVGGGQAISMNDLGIVVGYGSGPTGVFVYYGGVTHDLVVDGGWTITTVGKINIFGQIAATGTKAGSTTTYAPLLTPSLF